MAFANTTVGNHRVTGNLLVEGEYQGLQRTDLPERTGKYTIPLTQLRQQDDFAVLLPATALTPELGIDTGTRGTNYPHLYTEDLAGSGSTSNWAAFSFALPPDYDDGGAISVNFWAGMETTIADTSATLDCEVYQNDLDGTVAGADLCTTSAIDINSTTLANRQFTVTPTGLVAGDELGVWFRTIINDGATGTVVRGFIGSIHVNVAILG